MTPIGRFNLVASLVALLVGLQSNAVRAQSAFDGFDPGADNSHIMALAIQTDGKVVVGGGFATLGGGGTGTASRNFIGRLNPDGTIDNSFDPGANQGVFALAVQPDGKILVGGAFTMLGGGGTGTTERSHIGRLNADGSLDASFNPGASDNIYSLAVQADGKILVGGIFATLGGAPRNLIGRLNADGSLDATFDPGANNSVRIVLPQPDGRIIVGGGFTTLGGGGTGSTMRNRSRAPQCRRFHRSGLRSGHEQSGPRRQRLHLRLAAGWQDCRWRILHDAGRWRIRHDTAQQNRPAQCRRHARHRHSIRALTPTFWCSSFNRMAGFLWAGSSRHSAAAAPAQPRATSSDG